MPVYYWHLTSLLIMSDLGQIAGNAIGAGISGLFGLLGQRQQIKAQKEENKLAFERNQQLAQQQNQMNIAQWNRANEYNSPTAVVQRLKDAGLSPTLAYSNGTGMQSAQMSPDLSAGQPYQPVDMTLGGNRKTFGDVFQQAFNAAFQSRQMSLMQSQIEKTDAETEGKRIENIYLPQLTESEINERVSQMGLNDSQKLRTLGLIENDKLVAEELKNNIELIKSKISNLDVNSYAQLVNLQFKKQEVEISRYIAESNKALNDSNIKINNQQYRKMVELLPYEVEQANLNNQKTYSDIMLNLATHAGILSDNEVKAYEAVLAGQKKEFILENTGYTNYLMVIDAVDKTTKVIESISRTINNIVSLFTGGSDDESSSKDYSDAVKTVQWATSLSQ